MSWLGGLQVNSVSQPVSLCYQGTKSRFQFDVDWRKANVRDRKISRDTADSELSWKQSYHIAANTQKKAYFSV